MKVRLLLPVFLLCFGVSQAQFTLNTTNFSTGSNVEIAVASDINFNSSTTIGNANLRLVGNNQTINTSTARTLPKLYISNGGTKTFNGDYIINQQLSLVDGMVVPQGGFLIGAAGVLDPVNAGSATSFVAGKLLREFNGTPLVYPIGVNGSYTPVSVVSATGANPVIGITAFDSAPAVPVEALPQGVVQTSTNWSWGVTAPATSTFTTAIFSFPFLLEDRTAFGEDGYRPVVLYNESGQPTATLYNSDINASSVDAVVTTQDAGGKGTYFVGKELLFTPVVNNVITPDGNGMNDYLTVVNLSLYPENSVTLIDRYGVEVYTKDNYISPTADDIEGEDFSFLPAGNYVCILRYTDPSTLETFKIRQTITVLN